MNEDSKSQTEQRRTRGATAVEYALILALIAGIVIAAVGTLGQKTEVLYNDTETELSNATS